MSSHPNAPPIAKAIYDLRMQMDSHPHKIMASPGYQWGYIESVLTDIIAEMPQEQRDIAVTRLEMYKRVLRDETNYLLEQTFKNSKGV